MKNTLRALLALTLAAGPLSAAGNRASGPVQGPAVAVAGPALGAPALPALPRDLRFDLDVAVAGSGYGGSVMALRLAEAGLRVGVLERGQRFAMGQLPRDEAAYFEPEKGRLGHHQFRDLGNNTGWIGAGVGGGSLVNAAIMLRKNDFSGFPEGINERTIARFYDIVEEMLGARPFPVDDPASPHFGTPKTEFIRDAARALGTRAVMPRLAVRYGVAGEPEGRVHLNVHGAPQQNCRGCGECSLPGCNYGAKNTLDLNYLKRAEALFGARVLPRAQADRIEPLPGGGYRVHFADPETGAPGSYTAKTLVLAAGTLGSTELLLRNREVHGTLRGLSARLGDRYTTNGNFIGFLLNANRPIEPQRGPEITAGIEFPGPDGKGQGFHIFDGSYRDPWMVLGRLVGLPTALIKALDFHMTSMKALGLFRPDGTLPLLVLGRDRAVGSLSLDGSGRLTSSIDLRANKPYYDAVEEQLKAVIDSVGGLFVPFPLWHLGRKIEVPHPLGGVPMGSDASEGVVDEAGRVFGHDGLVVLDGSIMPASLGVNPALTIAAIAERAAEILIAQLRDEGRVSASSPPEALP
jgi:cholesterol oxidase